MRHYLGKFTTYVCQRLTFMIPCVTRGIWILFMHTFKLSSTILLFHITHLKLISKIFKIYFKSKYFSTPTLLLYERLNSCLDSSNWHGAVWLQHCLQPVLNSDVRDLLKIHSPCLSSQDLPTVSDCIPTSFFHFSFYTGLIIKWT